MKGQTVGKLVSNSGRHGDELSEGAGAAIVSARNAENLATIAEVYLSAQTARTRATINRGIKSDAVARQKVTHVCADGFHNSGCFMPHYDGRNPAPGRAVVTVHITAADSTGGYANQKFVRPESWDGEIGDFQMSVCG